MSKKIKNISEALEHFNWKFENVWKASEKDVEAFNTILDFKELVESENINANESLAKLWIHQFLLFSWTNRGDAEASIDHLDTILKSSVYDWVKVLQKDIPMLKVALNDLKVPIKEAYTKQEIEERNKYYAKIHRDITNIPKEDDLIKFVNNHITRVINKFEK